jgi:hypothetical protein
MLVCNFRLCCPVYEEIFMRFCIAFLATLLAFVVPAIAQEDEIVANLAGGRIIIHVARDAILFAAIDHPLEVTSVPPRVAQIDRGHIAVFLGASEWQLPAAPKPIRLDLNPERVFAADPHYQKSDSGENDLEQIGVSFLERLRPLVSQLHHKIDLKPDDPLLQIVLIGYAPQGYGPEVWLIEYRVEQQQPGANADYLQTRVLRPRFTQLYPPEKHEAHTLVEIRAPADLPDVPLLGLIQQNDPRIAKLRASDPHFAKVIESIERGQAQKAASQDAADFLRAIVPLLAGKASFIQATLGEESGFRWVVPPSEPIQKATAPEEKDRPPDAPTLRRKPNR